MLTSTQSSNIKKIDFLVPELSSMNNYPKEIFYLGKKELLNKKKISIVGTRRPISYTKSLITEISSKLSSNDICIVSGAAMGTDAIAHSAAKSSNTIAVVANGLDIKYPAVNKKLILDIEQNGLVLSTYKEKEKARKYTFVHRNELVVALGDILIVSQADINSGTISSIDYALKMNKKVYTLAHRINDSLGTNKYVKEGLIEVIYDVEEFIKTIAPQHENSKLKDEFLEYCKVNSNYDDAVLKYQSKVFEYELEGKILVQNGSITVL